MVLQVVDEKTSLANGSKSAIAQPRYSGIKNVFQSVYREGGMRGLYRGVGMHLYVFYHFLLCGFMNCGRSKVYQRSLVNKDVIG